MLVLHVPAIICFSEVFHLPGTEDLFGHGVIEISIEEEYIFLAVTVFPEFCSNVFLCTLGLSKHYSFQRYTFLLLLSESGSQSRFQRCDLGI